MPPHAPLVYERLSDPVLVKRAKDGDPRAGFCLLDLVGDEVVPSIERVPYDAVAVAREVRESGLPGEFAEKLVAAA